MKSVGLSGLILAVMSILAASGEAASLFPKTSELIAALDRQSEDELASFVKNSPDYTVGHILPVKGLAEIHCALSILTGEVDCHFLAHYKGGKIYHIATLVRDGDDWRILHDQTVRVSIP